MSFLSGLDHWIDNNFKAKESEETKALNNLIEDINIIYLKLQDVQKLVMAFSSDELSKQVDILNARVGKLETGTASRDSVEAALNTLDKKVSALMVANSFPQYQSVPHDSVDPMNLRNLKS